MGALPEVLERETVLAQLRTRYDEVVAGGGGHCVLLTGEAGIGKTALTSHLAVRVDAPVWWGQCDPLSTPRPLSPLLDMIEDPRTGLPDVVTGAAPYDAFAALLRHLGGLPQPPLVVLEDLHWADSATLDLLRFLGRRLYRCPALLVATFRDDEVGPDHPLAAPVGELEQLPGVVRVPLVPLTRDGVRQLTEKANAARGSGTANAGRDSENANGVLDAERVHALTGGNPFFVTEVLASGDGSSTTLRDAVLARLGRLDQGARAVVEAVALEPRALESAHAVDLADADVAAVERALRAGVLLESGGALRFRHELARAVVEDSVPSLRRARWHERLLELLLEASPMDLNRVVHHAAGAGNADIVRQHGPEAAREAVERGARREAAALLDTVLDVADAMSREDQVRLRHEAVAVLSHVDRQADALQRAEESVTLARDLGDRELLGISLTHLARARWLTGDSLGASVTETEAVEVLRRGPPGRPLAAALAQAANTTMLRRQHDRAMALAREACEVSNDVEGVAYHEDNTPDGGKRNLTREHGIGLIAWAAAELVTGDADVGVRLLLEVLACAEENHDQDGVTLALGMLGSGGGEARQYEEALGWLQRGIDEARSRDMDYQAAYNQAWQARIRCEQGRWDEAIALARGPAGLPMDRAVISRVTALSVIGRVRVRRGDPGAREVLERALEIGGRAELQHRWPAHCALAELAWLEGRPEAGREHLDGPWAEALATDSSWAQGEIGYWLWRCGGVDDVPDTAAEPFRLMVRGDWPAAAGAWTRIGCAYERSLALADGDDGARLEALAVLDRLGARPLALHVRGRLRENGVASIPRGPGAAARTHPAGLTDRQAQVHELLVAGQTYAEMAAQLYISPRTVEHHVSAVLAKYGVTSRDDLPAPPA